jgi:hypothetical protein
MNMKIETMKRIATLLVVVGVISTAVGTYTVFISPYIFSADYSQCRFTQSAGCLVVTKAPEYGLILIAIGALLYTSARTKKAGVVGREASSQVPPSQVGQYHGAEGAGEVLCQIDYSKTLEWKAHVLLLKDGLD